VPGGLSLSVWLLVRGIDLREWKVRAATNDINV
jgi:hypothetical protein